MPLAGHLNPMLALARELKSRGHQIIFFGLLDVERAVRAAGMEFVSFAEQDYPLGATPADYAHLATLRGEDVVRYSFQQMHPRRCAAMLRYLPERLSTVKVDALVIDTIHFYGELVAMSMGLPYVHIWNVLHIDLSGITPPCLFPGKYETTQAAIARNTEAAARITTVFAPVQQVAQSWAEEHAISIDWNTPHSTLSPLATITQTPRAFDFPGTPMPASFRHAGPLHAAAGRREIPFPWENLSDKPLIYASMGTLLNGLDHVFRAILNAASQLPGVQLVLSIGSNLSISSLGPIPSNTIVAPEAPQLELLARASLCLTHAGLNTVLESLSQGVPLVAIPVGFDQPGVASRIAYHRVGEVQSLASLSSETLLQAIRNVLQDRSYRENALFMQEALARNPGASLAADVIEQVL
jgi:zeaxanthin glucosyltransferase